MANEKELFDVKVKANHRILKKGDRIRVKNLKALFNFFETKKYPRFKTRVGRILRISKIKGCCPWCHYKSGSFAYLSNDISKGGVYLCCLEKIDKKP